MNVTEKRSTDWRSTMNKTYEVEEVMDALSSFQINFNGKVCSEIFGANDCDHYWNKWVMYKFNALKFWHNLDVTNRRLVLQYISNVCM
jgi:hypothetical protein